MRPIRFLSLFSGIEAASMAWLSLGWECVGFSEIVSFPCAVLAHYHSDIPNLGDVSKITEAQIRALGPVDVIVGGFPCQDLSVADKRRGLKNNDGSNTRSGLFFDAMRVVDWAKQHCGLRYALIENVPGLFSSRSGADFASVVHEMVGSDIRPPYKWKKEGCVVGPDGMLEWSMLDARWFGLAQRRKRVFVIADFGDWSSRPPILLEPESLRGNSPARGESREDVAPTISSRPTGGGGLGTDFDLDGGLIAVIQERAVCENPSAGPDGIGVRTDGLAYTLEARQRVQAVAFGGNNQSGPIDVATALNAHGGPHGRQDFESETFIVAPTLTGRPYADDKGRETALIVDLTSSIPVDLQSCTMGGDIVGALDTSTPSRGGGQAVMVHQSAVRRLTPRECERLQGFIDNYTDIPYRGKAAADGPRYKSLGNSMAVPVMLWIGGQINRTFSYE